MLKIRHVAAWFALSMMGCADPASQDDVPVDLPSGDTAGDDFAVFEDIAVDLPEMVVDDLIHGIPTRMLVQLAVDPVPEHTPTDPRRFALFAERWPGVVAHFEAKLPLAAFVDRTYRHVPVISIEVDDLEAAYAILDDPDVARIEADVIHEASDTSALALINQPQAAARGFLGNGTSVVIVDTGLDYTHSDFGCTAVGQPSSCRVVAAQDMAIDDGALDDHVSVHGTNVAAIVGAVAPGADLIGLDVFTNGSQAFTSDILEALDWSVQNQATYNIAAINMSLGAGGHTSQCGNSAFEAGIAAAKAAGMSVVVAAGNDGFVNAIASPACSPSAFTVGAVLDQSFAGNDCTGRPFAADSVACFSNSASFLDILAPGVDVSGGGVTLSGTSMAAPHVAGAIAVLRAADPNASVDELEQKLVDNAVSVTDARNGLTFPRLDLNAAVDGQSCTFTTNPTSLSVDALGESGSISVTTQENCDFTVASSENWITVTPGSANQSTTLNWTALPNTGFSRSATLTVANLTIDVTQAAADSPSGGVVIDGGAATNNTGRVTLTLDSPGSQRMCISNISESCRTWETYATTKEWRLRGRNSGERTVTVWFEAGGVIGDPVSDTIVYDRVVPRGGNVTAQGAIEGITLSWGDFTDDYTGIASYKVVQSQGRGLPRSRCTETPIYEGTDTTLMVPDLDGTYNWRVCPVDGAGNVGTGDTISFTTRPEYTPPTGEVSLANGSDFTNATRVPVALTATDASGVSQMCLSPNPDRCTRFVQFASTTTVQIRGAGSHTVYAWFKDLHGNIGGPFQDTVTVETTAPLDGAITVEAGDQTVTITPSGFSDAESGLAGYIVLNSSTTEPGRRCRSGEVIYEGSANPIVLNGRPNGETHHLRVCAVDAAGNVSSGVAAVATPVPESTGPVGTIDIENGARYSRSSTVTVNLSAQDDSGVTDMCITSRPPCRRFRPFESQVTWTIGTGDTTITVRFRDQWGNEGADVSDVIGLDRTAPKDGTLQADRSDSELVLRFTNFTDDQSGVASYKLFQVEGVTPPRSCRGNPSWTGTSSSVTLGGLTNGTPYSFLVCAVDAVGNTSRGTKATFVPAPELDAPTGSVEINEGETWTGNRRVELKLDATDASGVARMCVDVRSSDTCTRWIAYQESYRVSLAGAGQVPVRVWFEDVWGNQTSTYVEDVIGYDATRPVDGVLTATANGSEVDLAWSGFEDGAGSGVASYTVRAREGRAPPNCRVGDLIYTGPNTEVTTSGLLPNTRYGFRVCATDQAGNTSRGISVDATTGLK
ncbi:MAG: S8 family serine peptidase [Myxococcota bacterium]